MGRIIGRDHNVCISYVTKFLYINVYDVLI